MHAVAIHHLFERQAIRTPDATALRFGDRRVSYQELNRRANALACTLRHQGVGPNALVGLLADRSVEMVAGILAILKAGAAYLPLDPNYPVERLTFMTGDAGLPLVLAAPGWEKLAGRLGTAVLPFPAGGENPAADGQWIQLPPGELAYVMYTSGSTGRPKGVRVTHAGLPPLVQFMQEEMGIGPGDRVLQCASFSFDVSVLEIFAALTSGAMLILARRDELLPGPSLHGLLCRHEVTVAVLSPSVLRILPPEGLDLLRIVVASMEKLSGDIIERWRRPGRRFFNAYGPTEGTIFQTVWEAPATGPIPDNPPIGRPTPGVAVWLLGPDGCPVLEGESGELCLGGVCLARGYVNRPEQTREKFVTLRLGPGGEPVELYRTGDVARQLPDGNLEYLGRMDLQVKVRGFRVELREIETVLDMHPAVGASAVTADHDGTGFTRLWGYFVPRAAVVPPAAELQAFLAQRLPDYMIPSGFTCLQQWPLTPNGKLDRRALPHPSRGPAAAEESRLLSATETRVLGFCRDILDHPALGADAPLLEAGMHSLALAQLAWHIRHEFGIGLSFSQLFAQPTAARLARLVEELRPAQAAVGTGTLPATARTGDLPLSFAQQRVWFLEQLHPGNQAYHFQAVLRWHGRLNVPALEAALNDLVQRHEIWRTTFPAVEGSPVQRIHAFEPFTLVVEEESREDVQRRVETAVREPFELAALPLVRWRLFRVGPEEHWLLHREHHLVHDGWAWGVALGELFALYDARARGQTPSLPPLSVQFGDFAAWQRHQVSSGRWDDQLACWQARLADAPPPAEFPSDWPRPPAQTFRGAQFRVPLDALFADLLAACARENVTPHMWLNAAFLTLLHRYSGQTDIVVGTGFANRHSPESRQMLGMIINTVALRTDFLGRPSFREVLARVRSAVLEAADNQDAPYDLVVQRLGARTPLFSTFFDSYDRPFPSYQGDAVRVECEHVVSNGTCKFDVVALVIPGTTTAPTLLWEYNTDLFSEATASAMLRHFLALVAGSIANPELPVAALPMLSAQERERLVAVGRGPNGPSTLAGRRIEEIFAEVATARGDAPAIVCGEERLSYREVNHRAEDLASALRKAGAQPGEIVAFALPRGSQAICAMLAILKCGCAYLPLDPKLPRARVDDLLRIARPSVLLNADGLTRREAMDACGDTAPADAAYVLFTSGSTGVPKAVCVPHCGVMRLVCGVDYVRLDPQTRFLQLAPLSFDASTLEIWGPLLNGGTVVVHADDLPAFTDLGRTIAAHRVTTAWLTASLFNQIISAAPEILRPLRELLTGGEALSVPHVLRALAELPGTALTNGYGPTETTTFATTFPIPRHLDPAARRVPIGRPLPDTQLYVLNELGQPQPVGVIGEIFIGGKGVALGYRGDDPLTAARFVPDPFSGRPGARMYRTGDRGRWLPDGTLDFIERCDRQVKIHGFRIEPGEIESVLAQHPGVREAFVTVLDQSARDRRLVAYVVMQPRQAAAELLPFLRDRLPDYMVPGHVTALDALPKTPSGKLNRDALPRPSPVNAEGRAVRMSARTHVEEVVAGIWARVLGWDQVDVEEDFFLRGGHSLLALQLIHELNTAFGLDLPVRLLFTEPTVSGQARAITLALASQNPRRRVPFPPLVPLRPGGSKPPFFLVAGGFGGENELLVYAGLARYLDSQRPYYGLRARGVDAVVEPHETVEQMAAEYVREIRAVQPHGPFFIGGGCVGAVVAFELAHQLRAQGEPIGSLVLMDSPFPTRLAMARNRLRYLWQNDLLPLVRRCRAGRHEFHVALRDRIRLLVAPTDEQKIDRRRTRIAWRYLSRLLRYRPRTYPGPVTLLVCEQSTRRDPARVWRDLAGGGLEIHLVPGDHATHLRDHAQATAARIDACLQKAEVRRTAA